MNLIVKAAFVFAVFSIGMGVGSLLTVADSSDRTKTSEVVKVEIRPDCVFHDAPSNIFCVDSANCFACRRVGPNSFDVACDYFHGYNKCVMHAP